MNHYLRVLLTSSCWLRNYHTSNGLSRRINEALDRGDKPIRRCGYTHTLGDMVLWTRNYPYAFGYECDTCNGGPIGGLPDRRTVFRLWDSING